MYITNCGLSLIFAHYYRHIPLKAFSNEILLLNHLKEEREKFHILFLSSSIPIPIQTAVKFTVKFNFAPSLPFSFPMSQLKGPPAL